MFKKLLKLKLSVFICLTILFCQTKGNAQFPPPADQVGTTALHKDSSIFIAWAVDCQITRGYQDISEQSLGFTSAGLPENAIGKAGQNGVVSLGDGGEAILTFEHPIYNGTGWDFAVFENGFSNDFLELAFVEVSSDGINYFRFPATSLTQDSVQIEGFGTLDATKIDNLAGKYRVFYGTPFDLEDLKNEVGLNVNAITHIKIIDVVGCILEPYASYDHLGNIINDPWPTAFPTGGFDLDAVGVIHSHIQNTTENSTAKTQIYTYPNPAIDFVKINMAAEFILTDLHVKIINIQGVVVKEVNEIPSNNLKIDISSLNSGMYFIIIISNTYSLKTKFIKK